MLDTASSSVYPRACGGTRLLRNGADSAICGLSPRLRGNQHRDESPTGSTWGSIPAPAGEPSVLRTHYRPPHLTVYPRACGGTQLAASCTGRGRIYRSIPAPAGEPGIPHASPPVSPLRSIPAPAGEPRAPFRSHRQLRHHAGLSPRLRGNPEPVGIQRVEAVYPRACGGTRSEVAGLLRSGVYPRACGGTVIYSSAHITDILLGVYPRACGGTITSDRRADPRTRTTVYPRACGGTAVHPRLQQRIHRSGSIPAPAGEPSE